jgi:predicted nucleotidyltransferase
MNEKRASLDRICHRFGVAILYAFGSRGKEALAWLDAPAPIMPVGPSDLDIGVKALPEVRWSLAEQIALTQQLEDLFGVHRIDLIVLGKANPYLAAEVIHGERLYCEDEYRADLYDLYVLRREADLAFLEDERARSLLGAAA